MKNREPGIDLLRCFALLCVVGVHSCLYNNFYSIPQKGLVMWAADSFRWMFFCCNILFMMLTGYLKSGKQYSKGYYRSLIGILLSYVLCCAVSFPIRHFWLNDQGSLYDWITLLVTFGNYGWYVEMYIGLFLLSPFLNIILDKLNTPKQFCWLAGTMVFLTAVPSVIPTINVFPDYWTGLYPLTMYVLGAGVRKFRPQIPSWVAGLAAAAVLMLMGFFSSSFSLTVPSPSAMARRFSSASWAALRSSSRWAVRLRTSSCSLSRSASGCFVSSRICCSLLSISSIVILLPPIRFR